MNTTSFKIGTKYRIPLSTQCKFCLSGVNIPKLYILTGSIQSGSKILKRKIINIKISPCLELVIKQISLIRRLTFINVYKSTYIETQICSPVLIKCGFLKHSYCHILNTYCIINVSFSLFGLLFLVAYFIQCLL